MGIALLFNIKLPINFNSPYKALNIQDFWRRWHITLSRFLRDYIYIPLGGNRISSFRTYKNLLTTFIIGGFWHGAGWTFIFWGFLHGLALVINSIWKNIGFRLPKAVAWFITFNFVNIAWIFFRAKEWEDAINILKAMFGFNSIVFTYKHYKYLSFMDNYDSISFGVVTEHIGGQSTVLNCILAAFFIISYKNSIEMKQLYKPNIKNVCFISTVLIIAIFNISSFSEFLYFNF